MSNFTALSLSLFYFSLTRCVGARVILVGLHVTRLSTRCSLTSRWSRTPCACRRSRTSLPRAGWATPWPPAGTDSSMCLGGTPRTTSCSATSGSSTTLPPSGRYWHQRPKKSRLEGNERIWWSSFVFTLMLWGTQIYHKFYFVLHSDCWIICDKNGWSFIVSI